ncbi:hypothetical protein [Tengunoibacter tsumagoiensis]|uniref:Uncharacterized protein n=1 Tax=Tengunoibacter tsumagoiensis TaxID=2014871 RepID=A0A402A5H5_9CHLR|nr:hypothetical protein [Tengunoibacter tsumagoiensis]GCE14306.1 hypothetical protein KTT_41650 [Tengunoibacter tsumagoiensis]
MERNEDKRIAPTVQKTTYAGQASMGNHQLVIITQLLQVAPNFRSIDELFFWLAQMFVQRLGIDVVQFWTSQMYRTGQVFVELRSMAQQNLLLPQYVVTNAQAAEIAEHLISQQQSIILQPVNAIFAQPQGNLLASHNLRYWSGYFMGHPTLLLPPHKEEEMGKVMTPLRLVVSVFFRQPPNQRLMPTLVHILQQAIPIAKAHGLLFQTERPLLAEAPAQKSLHSIFELIPERLQDGDTQQAHSPFRTIMTQLDAHARRLYIMVDGRKNVGEIADLIQLPTRDLSQALRNLLNQQYIQLHESNGQIIDGTRLQRLLILPD